MITLNQNQFVALSMEEMININGGMDPWAQKIIDFCVDLSKVIVAAGAAIVTGIITYKQVVNATN